MTIHLLPLAAPLLLLIAAIANFSARGARPLGRLRLAETLAFVAVLVAVVCVALLATAGPMTAGSGMFAIRLDIVSLTMLALVSFVGWIVTRYSRSYLDGEARQGAFCGWLAMTLACVMLLVTAGNLILFAGAWIATSLSLHRLLLFYPERPAAQRAARKKFITARLADAALIGAFALLAGRAGSIDIMTITDAARTGALGGYGIAAAALMALAAVLKSAQFPLHGWLTEVMEAPTPVSALLHAGIINAGGFLLIRLADCSDAARGATGGACHARRD
jgi:NAD(P)H-quinone oxidoreductase subunit 5